MTQNKNKTKMTRNKNERISERQERKIEINARFLPIFYWTD